MEPMYVCIWEYRVRAEAAERFVERYGPDGDWARLFRRGQGYLGTTLLRDTADDLVFVTFDSWESETQYRAFSEACASEYDALDAACEELTESERRVGCYETEDPADPGRSA